MDITLEQFHRYRDDWLLWRALGHYVDESWVAPVSFVEASEMAKEMIDTFKTLDDLIGRMRRQFQKKKATEDNGK